MGMNLLKAFRIIRAALPATLTKEQAQALASFDRKIQSMGNHQAQQKMQKIAARLPAALIAQALAKAKPLPPRLSKEDYLQGADIPPTKP